MPPRRDCDIISMDPSKKKSHKQIKKAMAAKQKHGLEDDERFAHAATDPTFRGGRKKRKLKIMNHQIEQLKEEITAKDHALVKEHFDHQKVEKQKEQLKNELSQMQKLLEANEHGINAQDAEIRKLTHMIRRMDDDVLSQRPAVLRCLHAIDARRL